MMFNQLRQRYRNSAFAKNLAVMLTGNGVGLLLPFLLAPFIARLYSPEDFAGFELFAMILSVLVATGALRYELTIILSKTEEETDGLFKLSLRVLLLTSVLIALIFIPFRQWIGAFLENKDLPDLLWFLPVAMYISGILLIFNTYLMRLRAFKSIARNKILATATIHGGRYFTGLGLPSALGLAASYTLGVFIPVLTLSRKREIRDIVGRIRHSKVDLIALARKYREFPMVNSFQTFMDEGQKALLVIIVSISYGELTLGLFAFTLRYLRIPVQVFGNSLSQVFLPQLAEDYNQKKDIRPDVLRLIFRVAALGIIPFTVLMFVGEPLFGWVFSEEWRLSGKYAEIMAPWLFFNFIMAPLSLLPTVVSRQRSYFFLSLGGNGIALITAFVSAGMGSSFLVTLIAISIVYSLVGVFFILWFLHLSNPRLRNPGKK